MFWWILSLRSLQGWDGARADLAGVTLISLPHASSFRINYKAVNLPRKWHGRPVAQMWPKPARLPAWGMCQLARGIIGMLRLLRLALLSPGTSSAAPVYKSGGQCFSQINRAFITVSRHLLICRPARIDQPSILRRRAFCIFFFFLTEEWSIVFLGMSGHNRKLLFSVGVTAFFVSIMQIFFLRRGRVRLVLVCL